MAAYAALVSLRHIVEHLQHHPRPPISLDETQVQSLTHNLNFLQQFLESCNGHSDSKDAVALEEHIADAAHTAEDIIESHIVDQVGADGETIGSVDHDLYQALQGPIRQMDSMRNEAIEIKEKMGVDRMRVSSTSTRSFRRSPSATRHGTIVGFDGIKFATMEKLIGQQSSRQVIPIVGMGGIGKTALTRNIYEDEIIVQHFHIRAWATFSQEYNSKDILEDILLCVMHNQVGKEVFRGKTLNELGMALHKSLSGRLYLVVLDDIWSVVAWDEVKVFFPDNNNGSRIMITSRLSNVAVELSGSHCIEMSFLDEGQSWDLLRENVFGDGSCPLQLEEVGKTIAKNCKGLPLSIVVIGGFLAKSQRTREYWEYIAENLNSILNLEDDERCLKILHMSYNQLPIHLKPCFLYMGVFQEDAEIRVSSLIKLWVAEGFLKPISGKSLELVARYYVEELIDRNLILVRKFGASGNIKLCTIHDLLRDLCLREAKKQRFYNVITFNDVSPDTSNSRRICFPQSTPSYSFATYYSGEPIIPNPETHALISSLLTRTLICDSPLLVSSLSSRLLRVFKAVDPLRIGYLDSLNDVFRLINSRYIGIEVYWHEITGNYLSSLLQLWNLQTLIVEGPSVIAPAEFWYMSQLRHVKFRNLELPEPSGGDGVVLSNLQTLSTILNFKCSDAVVRRIPNIKKLRVTSYDNYCPVNLRLLHRLESLCCIFHIREEKISQSKRLMQNLTFPSQLKKLTLLRSQLDWVDMTRIGSLRYLEVLKLKCRSFMGSVWETVEGQFESLKYLLVEECLDLECWSTDGTHFPRLERLVLRHLDKLKEIPLEIGEIATLQSIELDYCSDSAAVSAEKISEEQVELGNVEFRVRVRVYPWEVKD